MKRIITLTLAVVMLLTTCVFASPAPDWTADSLCTRVASMTYYTQSVTMANGKAVDGALVKTHVIGYESGGNRTQYLEYGPDGKQTEIYVYNYIDSAIDTLQLVNILQYDGVTKKVKFRETINYDGKITTSVKTDVDGKLVGTTKYYANDNNLDYLVEVYDASGRMTIKTETQYNADGFVVSQVEINLLTGITTSMNREYVPGRGRISSEVIRIGNELFVNVYEYEEFDDNWVIKNSYKSSDGTTNSRSLVLYEKEYRLIAPFG